MNISCLLNLRLPLLESILWDDKSNCLWFVSIFSPSKLYRYNVQTLDIFDWDLPEIVGCIALTTNENKIIVALSSRIAVLDISNGLIDTFVSLIHDHNMFRMARKE